MTTGTRPLYQYGSLHSYLSFTRTKLYLSSPYKNIHVIKFVSVHMFCGFQKIGQMVAEF